MVFLVLTIVERLLAIAGEQRGYLVPADARAVGVDPAQLPKLAARGRLEHVAHGVYRLPTFPRRPGDELMEAVASTGKRGAIASASALEFYELCDVSPSVVTLVVPPSFRRRNGDKYRFIVEEFNDNDVEVVRDIPLVVPALAIRQAIRDGMNPKFIAQAIQNGRRLLQLSSRDVAELTSALRRMT